MFQNIYVNRSDYMVHLWDDSGKYSVFPHERYGYVIDPEGKDVTMNGLKVKKVKNWSKEAEKEGLVFEHDVRAETRVLIDRYYESDEPSKNHRILFLDIEIVKGEKYSKPKDALNVINAISYYKSTTKTYHCLLLDEENRIENKIIDGVDLRRFDSEHELLLAFMDDYQDFGPTILTSWNGDSFDLPYLYKRMVNLFGTETANRLSPIGIIEDRLTGIGKRRDYAIKIAGVSQLDYLLLYKNYTYNEEPRYTLDAIAKKELGRGKVEYEGSLDDLFRNDIMTFIRYNVSDVELLVAMDKKLDFIEIARGICHKGHVPYEDFSMSSRFLDGASLVYCKKNGLVAAGVKSDERGIAEGAFVKMPRPGLYEFVYTLDATSLYPSDIINLNISPETLFGKIKNWNEDEWVTKKYRDLNIETYVNNTSEELFGSKESKFVLNSELLKDYLDQNNLSIASNGCMYKLDKVGLIPSILIQWFAERKEYRKLASDKKNAGDIDGYRYYDKKQLVTKILLNSFYGVLLLPSFRFYNKNNGEAVTLTGQSVLQYAIKVANYYYNKKLNNTEELVDHVVMGDTDSIVLPALPLVRLDYDGNDEDILVERSLKVVDEVQEVVNRSFEMYSMRFHNVKNQMWEFKQEVISRRAFFSDAKKRYAMWIINKNGLKVDELEVKGLDMVRSSFPALFRKFQKEIVTAILHGSPMDELNEKVRNFKKVYKAEPIQNIMMPTGVHELSKYSYGQKGTPVHAKSAQNYNKLLDLLEINSIPRFEDSDKILWAYLRQNPYGFDSIALRGYDDPPELVEYVTKFIDRDQIFNNAMLTKLETIWEAIGWGKVDMTEPNDYF